MVLFSYPSVENEFFSLSFRSMSDETYCSLHLLSPTLNTYAIPQTYAILCRFLPSIRRAKCFNDRRLPFSKEVKHTEIGHLFEHILLEYLYRLKSKRDNYLIVVKGETFWNWKKDPEGMFHIVINSGLCDGHILPEAIKRSIDLLKIILYYDPYYQKNKNKQMAFCHLLEQV